MSYSLSNYIGPYIKIDQIKKEITKSESICGNNECKNNGKQIKTPFCPHCGKEAVVKKTPEVLSVGIHQASLPSNFFDKLCPFDLGHKGSVALTANNQSGRPKKFKIDDDCGISEIPTDMERQADIDWFKNHFSSEIKQLEDFFGAISIEYGVVSAYF